MRGLSQRAQLAGLVTLIVVPLVAGSAWLIWRQYEGHREALGAALLSVSRALSAAADRELAIGLAVVETLANSPALDRPDLAGFHALAAKAAASRVESNIVLFAPSGQMLVHTGRPWGTALPNVFEQGPGLQPVSADQVPRGGAAYVRQVFATGKPVISDVFAGQISGSHAVAVSAPVMRDGQVVYCLTIGMPAHAFQPLVAGKPALAGAGAVLFDARGFIIARAIDAERFVGKPIPPDVRRAVLQAPESVQRGRNVEGEPVFRAVTRSPVTGWSAGVAFTEKAAFGALSRSMRESAAVALAILILGVVLALWMARTLARRRMLEAETRAKDEFLAALSHELRNPLSAIALSAELLQRVVSGNRIAEDAVNRVARQVGQLRRLLDDLLDATRAAHGKLNLQPRALELRACAAGVAGEHRRRPGPAVEIQVGGQDVWVSADPTRLHQMVDNLLENATKYGARRVQLQTGESPGFGLLAVSDDGQGIAPELLGRLFEPFVQGEQSLDRAQGGLGLGLALVKRLAQAQGGSVEARSPGRGRGSVFTVRLPLAAPAGLAETRSPAAPVQRCRILVVEDLEDARESLKRLLEAEGHEVVAAANGPRALALMQSFRPGVAFIDIGLPGMNGYEVARLARGVMEGPVRLLALTGYGQQADRDAATEAGFDGHLTKPVTLEQLRAALAGSPHGEPTAAVSSLHARE